MDVRKKQQKTFLQEITHSNYIVRDHRVHDVRTLPGVALLDMIYRLATAYIGSKAIELKHIVFKKPVVTSECFDRNVFVTFTPQENHWKVVITSGKMKNNCVLDTGSDENMECLLFLHDSTTSHQAMDVDAFINKATLSWDIDEAYKLLRKADITHFEFMKTRGMIYQYQNEELMKLHLSELAEKYRQNFCAHPAFLDASTFSGCSFQLSEIHQNLLHNTPYIPFMIERFSIYHPFPDTIYTHSIRPELGVENISAPADIFSTDITVMDETGLVLAEFGKLTLKRIREPDLIRSLIETDKPDCGELSKPEEGHQHIQQQGTQKTIVKQEKDDQHIHDSEPLIISYLQEEIGNFLQKSAAEVDIDMGFYDLGLDSIYLLGFIKKLEQKFDKQLYPTLLFEYSSIRRLADYLSETYGTLLLYSDQPVLEGVNSVKESRNNNNKLLFFEPIWARQEIITTPNAYEKMFSHLIILLDQASILEQVIKRNSSKAEVITVSSKEQHIPAKIEDQLRQVLEIVQKTMRQKKSKTVLIQVVADFNSENQTIYTLGGLLKTAHLENPKINSQIITFEHFQQQPLETIHKYLKDEAVFHNEGAVDIHYTTNPLQRFVKQLREINYQVEDIVNYKENCVYVITGGLGGLGLNLAKHIASRRKVKLVLIGRSRLEEIKEDELRQLRENGTEVLYLQADISRKEDTVRAFKIINDSVGPVHGIFHCAGVLKDQFLTNKDVSEIEAVFQPKVQGLWNLDEVSAEEPLEFFVMFSSISAITGNPGQADYASANAFMDNFSLLRYEKAKQGKRSGRTLVINWPLWSEGGMRIDNELAEMMYQSSGIRPLPTKVGLLALDIALQHDMIQNIVLYGEENKLRSYFSTRLLPEEKKAERNTGSVYISSNIQANCGQPDYSSDDIAIIGMSGRYPMANTLDQFYQNLREGKDCITGFPKNRWKDYEFAFDVGEFYKYGGFVDDIERFDPLFFNIAPSQAEIMDPQARLFLEIAWEACEDAGFCQDKTKHHFSGTSDKSVGVFTGVFWSHYELFGAEITQRGRPTAFGVSSASIPNMVSHYLNFHGPSMAIDTMCSSALTSIHLACDSIRKNECHYALAGGVNLVTHPHKFMFLKQANFLSSDGRCKSFGEGGDGYVPGEGVGAVLLTSLERAKKEGFSVYAVIKGSALNHAGRTSGVTVPDPVSQSEVITNAIEKAGIDPRTISYVEAHGTGTSLGDPIEIQGLCKAYNKWTRDKQYSAIGSLKSNIGHLEAAAGIAGLTKVVLQIKNQELFPTLHSETANPYIPFWDSPFYLQRTLEQWKPSEKEMDGKKVIYPRRAGLSSFGASGSNAHIILEEYIPEASASPELEITRQNPAIILLSAKNEERLWEQAQQLLAAMHKQQWSDDCLADMAYTLQIGREAMEERMAVIVASVKELEEKLTGFVTGQDGIVDLFRGQVKGNKETLAVFTADEDMTKAIEAWITKRKFVKLLNLWVKGWNFDWSKLYNKTKRRRMSLPTYPFARERYWVPEFKSQSGESNLTLIPDKDVTIAENSLIQRNICFSKKQWEQCSAASTRTLHRTVAILTTMETKELAIQLSQCYAKSRILDVHDLELQLRQSDEDWKMYDGCVDLIGCGKQKDGIQSWLIWLQQLIEHGHREGLMLLCVTKGLESYQNTAVNLSGASRVGLYRMLQSEYGHLQSRHMDTDPTVDDGTLAQQIAFEFLVNCEDSEVCYRNGERYRSFLQAEQVEDEKKLTPVFSPEQVVLITGGTRGIGYLCARHLVTHYGVKRLVLTGRETMPPREQWDKYSGQNSSIAQKIAAIQALEALGAQVQVLSLSLTDEHAVQESLEEIKNTMGPIGGVIHCAGLGDFENPAFIRKSLAGIQRVLDPKVSGLEIIYQNLKNEPLQFFVLFSSVSAIIPVLASGQSDYAMANAYMDYFAEANRHSCPIVSIEWPNWQETGMGEVKSRVYEQTGLFSLTDSEGLQLLDYVLSGKIGPVVLPAVINPDLWQPLQLMRRKIGETSSGSMRSRSILPDELATSDTLVMATQTWLTELFSQELKIKPSQLEKDIPFADYGVDSILLAQLLQKINQIISVDLDLSILIEYSTIESLAVWLVNTHTLVLSQALAPSVPPQPALSTHDSLPDLPVGSSGRQTSLKVPEKMTAKGVNPVDIAVIGVSCRFPGANTLEEYWEILFEGRSGIRLVPQERWGYSTHYYAGLLDNITHFDPAFFYIPLEDAKVMDPQALVILEESLKLWYQAGYSQQEIKGKSVGVYLGARSHHRPSEVSLRQARNPIVATGQNYLAANISHFFDLHGPSVVVDTACSSALVGMNMAIHALYSGEIEAALVGGVNLLTTDSAHRLFQQRGILSSEPSFHIFDQRASGAVLGEGVGMVLLKTLEQALTDGDNIYAVIKAVAINNDGRTAGPATPNLQAQKDVMKTALAKSGKKAEEVTYIEANGSGSEVTDLLELRAIQSIYRPSSNYPLGLGSVKTNIGHPLCAEGIASFIKVVLMLQHEHFVPFLSGQHPMKHYDMQASPFWFCRKPTAWTNTSQIAAINCFADGGTNAHVILEAWKNTVPSKIKRQPISPPELDRQPVQSKVTVSKQFIWETFG